MALQVVGAGFGRTGTNSLKLALEFLGYGPCHHMVEVAKRPEQIAFWAAAARGERRDWDTVFAGFRSAVDWPSAHYWRELCSYYAEAKVILTVRPEPDWLASMHATIHARLTSRQQLAPGPGREVADIGYEITERQTFGGRLGDPEHAIAVYRAHIAEVKRTIAPERLLVLDVAEGWAPLCAFLGVPVPATPFPRTNSAAEFQARTAALRRPPPAASYLLV